MRAPEKIRLHHDDANFSGSLVTLMRNEHVNAVRRLLRGVALLAENSTAEGTTRQTREVEIELREVRHVVARL